MSYRALALKSSSRPVDRLFQCFDRSLGEIACLLESLRF